jgi:hypothetical protein
MMEEEKYYTIEKEITFIRRSIGEKIKISEVRPLYTAHGIESLIKMGYLKEVNSLPKTWEELGKISGWYVSNQTHIHNTESISVTSNKNVFFSKEQAAAAIALAQLSQLKHVYNDGWVPDYTVHNNKYIIYISGNCIETSRVTNESNFLSFKTADIRDEFLKNFKDLIEVAKPLL